MRWITVILLAALAALARGQCSAYTSCGQCVSESTVCGWCVTAGIAGCMDVSTASTACPGAGQFINPTSAIISTSTNSTLISPDFVNAFTRVGVPLVVPITITPGSIPLDILLVEDLSGSMADDVLTLRSIAPTIVTRTRQEAQNDTTFGIFGFIEKSDSPSGFNTACQRFSSLESRGCNNYDGAGWLKLTSDAPSFYSALNTLPNTGNSDWPESCSEGIMKGALCPSAGWRTGSRKMMLISTDADFHVAGDGLTQGAFEPRQYACQSSELTDDYSPGIGYDYPSVSLLRQTLLENNIVPIFAVQTSSGTQMNNLQAYQRIVDYWGFGYLYQLTSDSSNIVDAIIDSYNTVAQTITIIPATDPLAWITEVLPVSGYSNAVLGTAYAFTVTVTASVPNVVQLLRLTSFGFGDIYINASSFYTCACVPGACPLSAGLPCAGQGSCECGLCTCLSANYTGVDCSCDESLACNPACQNGQCVCGACECNPGWGGASCNCSTLPCPGNGNCNGNGVCSCGTCACNAPFYGVDCFCQNGNCPATAAGNCSGPTNGVCSCGACQCLAGWGGEYCNCSTRPCPGLCSGHGVCTCESCECEAGWTGSSCECSTGACPVNPVTNLTCSGPAFGICSCGICQCSLATGDSCNCSSLPCPVYNGAPCGGHGTCECGACECAAPFVTPEASTSGATVLPCSCDTSLSCPSRNPPEICSGHGTCDCGNCTCTPGWSGDDCNCEVRVCDGLGGLSCSGHGTCECGECKCTGAYVGELCSCDSAYLCPNNCSGHGTCDVCGDKTCKCSTEQTAAPPPPRQDRAGMIVVAQRAVGDSVTYSGADCSCSNAPCEGGCGPADGSQGECVCGVCACKTGWLPPNCLCNPSACAAEGACVNGACDACGTCVCESGWTGSDCTICDRTVRDCTVPCTANSCGGCLADSQCAWCASSGNCTVAAVPTECSGGFSTSCSKAATALYNTTEFRAGAYALGALLVALIVAIILYKIWIWRRDKYLWEQFNQEKDWGVSQSPLYQDAFAEAQNPLYDANAPAEGSPSFF